MDVLIGKQAEDGVTGVAGTITAHCFYLHGSERVCIEFLDSDGKPSQFWIEIGRVRLLED